MSSTTTSTSMTSTSNSSSSTKGRLPDIIRPTHYDLSYDRIDFASQIFEGSVTLHMIGGSVTQEETIIQLHALNLCLSKATLQCMKKTTTNDEDTTIMIEATEFRYDFKNQICLITFPLIETGTYFIQPKETYQLKVHFQGKLNDQMRGLYRSTYTNVFTGERQCLATTQFEPTDARQAFPCLDEPAQKATFTLTVRNVPIHLCCISNTPVAAVHRQQQQRPENNDNNHDSTMQQQQQSYKTVTFQTTPKMSTYLVALILGDFDCISQTSRGIVTSVHTVPGKAHQAYFCLDVATRCLDLFQDLFQISYPLPKSDLIAIPDFGAGAMENYGAITFRETKVLVQEHITSESTKRGIARTICHELAHQWFGNLVSIDYWTQLYLKEGMARYLEFVGIDTLFPEWDAWVEFVQGVYGLALSLDAMKSSHPVEVEVQHPDEIAEIFDAISYAKGASLIRMATSYIGKELFFKGMCLYLSRHTYGNAVSKDLWQALEEVSRLPIVDFMLPWTLEMGFPLVVLTEDGILKTPRFLASGPENVVDETLSMLAIPITAKVEGLPDQIFGPFLIHGPQGDQSDELNTLINEWSKASKWFKLNVDQTGFYRVQYTRDQWSRLAKVMDPSHSPLSTSDRLGLLSDSFASGSAGYSSIVDFLQLIQAFEHHELAEYAVWQELSENLSSLLDLFRSESFFPSLQAFVRRIYTRRIEQLGWVKTPDEPGRMGSLRASTIQIMGQTGDLDVQKHAYELVMSFKDSAEDDASIPGDLRTAVFRCALLHDESKVFHILKSTYEEKATQPDEQRTCLVVMGCVRDHMLHAQMLDYVFWSGKVRLQDIIFPLSTLTSTTDEGGLACWNFLQTNITKLYELLGTGPMWSPCLGLCCSGVTTPGDIDIINDYASRFSSASRRLSQASEVVRTRMARRKRDREAVRLFLLDRY